MRILPFFSKKTTEPAPKEQPENANTNNSQLDKLKDTFQVLENEEMIRLEGGKSTPKPFDQIFTWNSSCGGTIPQ